MPDVYADVQDQFVYWILWFLSFKLVRWSTKSNSSPDTDRESDSIWCSHTEIGDCAQDKSTAYTYNYSSYLSKSHHYILYRFSSFQLAIMYSQEITQVNS